MNGVLVLSAHSGMLVYHRAFKPRFGFGALGSNELQLSSMLFAVYQCALSVDIADPDDGESSGLKRFRKAGIEVTFTVMSDKDLLLVSVVDACMSRNSRDLLVEQLRTVPYVAYDAIILFITFTINAYDMSESLPST